MATKEQLIDSFMQAHKAGDTKAASALAQAVRQFEPVETEPAPEPEKKRVLGDRMVETAEKVKDIFTGESRMTPEMETLPTIGEMPELDPKLREIDIPGLKSAFVSMTAGDKETVQALQANYPGLEARQDEKGNWIVKSPTDQKEYAVNVPGMDVRDIGKGALIAALFTKAGKLTNIGARILGAGLTQTGLEAGQAAAGGEFDAEQIPLAAAAETVVPAGSVAHRALKGQRPVAEAIDAASEAVRVASKEAPVEKMGIVEMGETVKRGAKARFPGKHIESLAEQVMPDPKVIAAAEELGIEDYLQPDHLTTNQVFRETAQAVKSVTGSKTKDLQVEALLKVQQRADRLIRDFGGTDDLSLLDADIKTSFETVISDLAEKADIAYRN